MFLPVALQSMTLLTGERQLPETLARLREALHMAKKSTAIADIEATEAQHGEKMIEVKLRFWTDAIAPELGKVVPKHAATSGVVRMERNVAHGIVPGSPHPFHSLLDVGAVIEQVLIDHGVVLHPGRQMQKYIGELIDLTAFAARKRTARKGAKSVPEADVSDA